MAGPPRYAPESPNGNAARSRTVNWSGCCSVHPDGYFFVPMGNFYDICILGGETDLMKRSAGILLFRISGQLEVFLVHPGGPFWKNKEAGAWTIPKGEVADNEDPLLRALIEFREETGQDIAGNFIELAPIRQKGGKTVHAWAVEGALARAALVSNTFDLEWPPKSGKTIPVPEVDRWEWFTAAEAKKRINPAQAAFIEELEDFLRDAGTKP